MGWSGTWSYRNYSALSLSFCLVCIRNYIIMLKPCFVITLVLMSVVSLASSWLCIFCSWEHSVSGMAQYLFFNAKKFTFSFIPTCLCSFMLCVKIYLEYVFIWLLDRNMSCSNMRWRPFLSTSMLQTFLDLTRAPEAL